MYDINNFKEYSTTYNNDYNENREFSDNLLNEQIDACLHFLNKDLTTAKIHYDSTEDVKNGTDVIIDDVKFSLRIRTSEYFKHYRNQFTIRSTEVRKLKHLNYASYMMYGFSFNNNLFSYSIINLKKLKELIINKEIFPIDAKNNIDNSPSFFVFELDDRIVDYSFYDSKWEVEKNQYFYQKLMNFLDKNG